MEQREYNVVGKSFRKKDSMQLLLGKPGYEELRETLLAKLGR